MGRAETGRASRGSCLREARRRPHQFPRKSRQTPTIGIYTPAQTPFHRTAGHQLGVRILHGEAVVTTAGLSLPRWSPDGEMTSRAQLR